MVEAERLICASADLVDAGRRLVAIDFGPAMHDQFIHPTRLNRLRTIDGQRRIVDPQTILPNSGSPASI